MAIVIYVMGGFLTDDYVLSVRLCVCSICAVLTIHQTVAVVVLLAADFWNCRVSTCELLDCSMVLTVLAISECVRENFGWITFLESG
jgi:hypothetical protein